MAKVAVEKMSSNVADGEDVTDAQAQPSRRRPTRKLTFSLGFRSTTRHHAHEKQSGADVVRHVDVKRFKKDRISELLEKSGLEDVLNSLSQVGSNLWKVRSPRNWYRRKFILDLGEMKLKYDPSYKTGCVPGSSKHIELSEMVDVRKGWRTDTFNRVGADQERRLKAKPNYKSNVEEKNCFSVIYGDKKESLDLVAPNPDVADKWVRCLEYLISWHTSKEQEKSYENWLRKKFLSADLDNNKCLSFMETMKLLEDLNIHMHETQAYRLFNEANIQKESSPELEVLDEDEFILFYFKLLKRPEIEELFDSYSSAKGVLRANELCQFLQKEQSDYASASIEDCEDLIQTYEQSDLKRNAQMSVAGFLNMLLSSKFDIFRDEQKEIYQDMNQPLSHYYIASSHNTYLMGNQLSGQSSVEGYVDALKRGCRCVELDLWDGEAGEPIIYHGYTLTTRIFLKEVLDDAIKPYAFAKSKYPLILSLENHCSEPVQKKVASYLHEILGDMLYTEDVDENMEFLPSPNELMGKILVKGKKSKPKSAFYIEAAVELSKLSGMPAEGGTQIDGVTKVKSVIVKASAEAFGDLAESSSEGEGETTVDFVDAPKRKVPKAAITDDLSSLVNLVQAVHFHSFAESKSSKCYHMSSFSEAKAIKFVENGPHDFIDYNKRQLSRIYPAGSRTGSSNFDPIQFWNAGCQIVALNYQSQDVPNYMNHARFAENAGCGYVLKPEFLRNPKSKFDPNEPIPKSKGVTLRLRIISGQHLPKAPGNPEIVDPYIEVKICGLPQDKAQFTTKSIHNNGFNPVWNECFETRVRCPELGIMYIRIKDHAHSGTDMPLAHYAIPVTAISPGYRHIQLQDLRGTSLLPSTLFVQVSVTPCSKSY